MKKIILLTIVIFTIAKSYAYEDSLLCWEKNVQQTDENAIVFLGTGAEFHDIERVNLDEINVFIEGFGKRAGDCSQKFYDSFGSQYSCNETVLVDRIYYSTAFTMELKLKSICPTTDAVVFLEGNLFAKRTHDEFNGPIIDKMSINVLCQHRTE